MPTGCHRSIMASANFRSGHTLSNAKIMPVVDKGQEGESHRRQFPLEELID